MPENKPPHRPAHRPDQRPHRRSDNRSGHAEKRRAHGGKPQRTSAPTRSEHEDRSVTENLPDPFYSAEQYESATALLAELDQKMKGLGARRAALDVLARLRAGEPLDMALRTTRTFSLLEGADRRFARNIVAHTLRRRGSLDAVISTYLDKPLPPRAREAMDILRITGVQLFILGTPAHAAVATATELTGQKKELQGYKGLINALSRRMSEKGEKKWHAVPERADTPGWLWRRWERQYGPKVTREIALAHRQEPPLDITLKDTAKADDFATLLEGTSFSNGTVRLKSGNISTLQGFETGDFWAQDLAASLPVKVMGDVRGKVIFDVCAAPGGKTMQLAAAGADVFAIDRSASRLKTLEENLARVSLKARTVVMDMLKWEPQQQADAVLLDAPCSATGTLRRNPDIAWSRKEEDIDALAQLQTRMIDHALAMLKPGGQLLYATCSLQKQEGEDQIDAALKRHSDVEIMPITAAALGGEPFSPLLTKKGTVRTLPSHFSDRGGMDGFFFARLRKLSAA